MFGEEDPYRAATNNKGVLNGIDAVVVATGNDWRAVEAGVHAYAGARRPLSQHHAVAGRRTGIWSASWKRRSSWAPWAGSPSFIPPRRCACACWVSRRPMNSRA